MRIIAENLEQMLEVEPKAQEVLDPVMAAAKIEHDKKAKETAEMFDAVKLAHSEPITGHDKKDYPKEMEMPKIELDESLFDEAKSFSDLNREQELDKAYNAVKSFKKPVVKDFGQYMGGYNDNLVTVKGDTVIVKPAELTKAEAVKMAKRIMAMAGNLTESNDDIEIDNVDINVDTVNVCDTNNEPATADVDESYKVSVTSKPETKEFVEDEKYLALNIADSYRRKGYETRVTDLDTGKPVEYNGRMMEEIKTVKEGLPDEKLRRINTYAESIKEEYMDVDTFIDQDPENGNAFWIMGYCKSAMQDCDFDEAEIDAMLNDATSGDYDHLCDVCQKYLMQCNDIMTRMHAEYDDEFDYEPETKDIDELEDPDFYTEAFQIRM